MLIIADRKIPTDAKENLEKHGEVIYLETSGITYEAISGHPDIFFCKIKELLIVAPNLPKHYKNTLKEMKISFIEGEQTVGDKYPNTASYNAASNENYLFHNFRYTDSKINELAEDLDLIHVNQGYCRCNLLPLEDDHFITSDEGIKRVLENYNFKVLYTNPSGIIFPGKEHGFFGGCCGVRDRHVFIIGSLSKIKDGEQIRKYLKALDYQITELYEGPLFDGGSLLFV